MFYKMLRRNILYTAITRAKAQVFLVGDKRAIYRAIHNTESDKRNTMLGERIIREYNMLLEDRNENNPIKANKMKITSSWQLTSKLPQQSGRRLQIFSGSVALKRLCGVERNQYVYSGG